jgi:ribulose-phosphate 3-epimerase
MQFHSQDGIHAVLLLLLRCRGAIRVQRVNRPIEIAPSILPADFARLGEECVDLEKAGAHRIHWDVMDGVFVPNITVGPDVVKSIRPHLTIHFEAHLMVMKPDEIAPLYIEAGCETVMVHAEACTHLHRSLNNIRKLGARSGVVLNPHTPAAILQHVLDQTDHILIMTVNPGFGGQAYIPLTDKIAELKAMVDAGGHDIDIEIDGGISATTIGECAAAGANVFVSGSALFKYDDRAAGVAELTSIAGAAR